jgi:putative DNA primase/helicase
MSASGNSRVVPIVPQTNRQFLEMLAGDQWEHVLVASYIGDPEDPNLDRSSWQAAPAGRCLGEPNFDAGNTYFCPMLFQPGTWRRQGLDNARSLLAITVDDVGPGQKVDEAAVTSLLGCGPTYLIETSPGNFQGGWKTTGMTNMAWVKGMLAGLDVALGGKADNLTNPIAWRRLPVGRNMKGSLGLGPQGWRVRTRLVRPDRSVDMLDFAGLTQLGTITPMTTLNRGTGDAARPDAQVLAADPVYQALEAGDRIVGEKITSDKFWAVTIRCPWIAEHGPARPETGAEYVPDTPGQRRWFHCFHCERKGRDTGAFMAELDVVLRAEGQKIVAAFEFDEVSSIAMAAAGAGPGTGGTASAPPAVAETTEDGVVRAFGDRHGGQLRFDHARQKWFLWVPGAGFWQEDPVAHAFAWARDLAREVRNAPDAGPGLRSLGKIAAASAIERGARTDRRLWTDGKSWDPNLWLAGAPGMTLDLRTGDVRSPDPSDMITKQLLVAPADPGTKTPLWDQFLWEATGGDAGMIEFLQAWCGYCLTGDTSEEKFVFLYGPGGNGKGVFLFTISAILHDYATRTPADTFMVRKHEAHPTEIARLMGVRAVTATEIEGGQTFNASRLKDFTGRDGKLMGRFMRRDWFEFTPQFKVTFVGNNQPRLTNVDDAMRRRVILVPFTQTPAAVNTKLKDQLVAEYSGILRWMIEGENRRRSSVGGLAALVPDAAAAATKAYLEDQDEFRAWAEERCVFGPGNQMSVTKGFEDYRLWCSDRGEQPGFGVQEFSRKFLRVFPQCQKKHTRLGWFLEGASLSPQDVTV